MTTHRLFKDQNRVTVHTVAERAGVSAMTVSNVINGTGRVSARTRERVLSVIADLGYTPNLAGRYLSGAVLSRIGLIYAGVESVFIDATIAAIAVIAAQHGIHLQVQAVSASTVEAVDEAARQLVRLGAQGLLLLPPYAEMLGAGEPLPVPAAAIATAIALPHISTVRIDNRAASRAMTERLLVAGRRRIAVLAGPQHHSDGMARLDGFHDALAACDVLFDPQLYAEGDFTFQSGLVAAQKLLDLADRPDAIIAGNDDMAAAALWVAHQRGLSLPADLAVAGFDDTLLATRVWPPLTTVRQPIKEMAEQAIECLAQAVRGSEPDMPRDFVLPFTLIERASA